KTPSQLVEYLFSKVGPHYYDRLDVHFNASERVAILDRLGHAEPATLAGVSVARVNRSDGFKFVLANESWLLVRFSGTEPIMRIYSEAESPAKVQELLAAGKAIAGV
ncbi:MAG TPA: phosphoglucomutase/phosphomannomutase family protein, partial [Chloroflexota bacterium]|nr:phosphoglucomutase/phosphomannomutase family protein [Chloroflexota bacterium]